MRTHRLGSRAVMVGLSVAWILFTAVFAPAQEPADEAGDSAERKVMERFLTVLEKTPRRGTALDRVYGYHVERGALDALVKRYEDRIKADANDGAAWLLRGLIESQRGRDAAAVASLREAERIRPDDPLPSYYLGQALVLVGQPDAAVDAFERALTRRPIRADLLEIYQSLGRVHQRARRSDKALAVWTRLEAAFPDDTRVREQIAAALAEEDQPAQALTRYEALAKDVKDEYRRVQMALEAAELKVRLGKAPEALNDFERLLSKLNPDSWLFKELRRKIEEVFLRNDDLAGLAKYYEGWIAKTPDDVEAMARLGRTLAHLGRAAESRQWLDKAVKLAPSRRDLRLALIEQLAQEKKFAEASAQYEDLAKAEPNNPDVIRDWGRLLLRDNARPAPERKTAAATVWKRLAGDDVKDPVVIAQAADLFRQAEMTDDAIALYKRAIALAPDAAQYREYLGEYYHQLKRPADALATWRESVPKTAVAEGRLGEVLAGFGYRKEALEPLTDAVQLAPDDFDLRLKLADLLVQLDRPLDALPELAAAGRVSESDEQREAVLEREIHANQAGNKLGDEVTKLKGELDAGKDATAPRWTRLARYYEADGKPTEAVEAASKGTVVDPKSITAWATLARLQESSGNLAAAAEADRKLAGLDRRNRADYLSAIARLEARLGRKEEALKAGRDLLAAAPGNVEHHEAFAELCFNLGEVDEGLEALRRAARANPSDPKAANTLADALARQFRTEEAIELYWRSFDKTKDLEGKLGLVARLTDQYLQRNQFDRLVARLERELREPESRPELTLCLAQAHQSAGDLGTARQELETLLASNARDTALLTQLTNLAEAEGDNASAARYLKQVAEITPSPEVAQRLAQLYLRAGEVEEAEAVWSKMASADQDAARAFAAIDGLLANGKNDIVLTLTERILLKRPNDWDALYREGVALMSLDRPADAAKRFQAILDLRDNDDDLAAIPKALRRRGRQSSSAATSTGTTTMPGGISAAPGRAWTQTPVVARASASYQIRYAAKLDNSRNSSYRNTTIWTPGDFGQARMAALGWLYAGSLKDKDPDAWHSARRAAADSDKADVRSLWDWYYLETVRTEARDMFAAALRLARAVPNDPSAQYVLLTACGARFSERNANGAVVNRARGKVDKTPPLPANELTLVLDGVESLRKRRPELLTSAILLNVTTELKRAKRDKDADGVVRRAAESAQTTDAILQVVVSLADGGEIDALLALADKFERLQATASSSASLNPNTNSLLVVAFDRAIGAKGEEKAYADILRLVDHFLGNACRPELVARRLKSRSHGATSAVRSQFAVYLAKVRPGMAGATRSVTVDFPTPNVYFDAGAIQVLRNAFEIYKRDDLLSDLIAHFRDGAAKAGADAKLYETLALSSLLWWSDDKEGALREYSRAIDLAKDDVELKMSLAELRAQRGEPAEALEVADSFEPLDQRTMQRRETLALRLSVLAGDVAREKKAAERLFGLRLDSDTQVQLATQMNQLGMHDLADAVLARARRRAGGNAAALVSLMLQYQKQGKAETAVQVANQLLRQGSGIRQYTPYYNENDQARTEALNVLGRSGKLKELIARTEAQLASTPNSLQVLQTLVDYYQADRQRDKVKATYERIAKLRPDDAKLRFQIGLQLARNGSPADSLEHYSTAIKKDPSLLSYSYYEVQNAFQQANKVDDLLKLYESVDLKAFGNNPYAILNLIQELLQDEKHKDQAMVLFGKAWKDLPDQRSSLMGSLYNDDLWKLPEIYDYAREACIPAANKPLTSPWVGIDEIISYNGDGTVNGLLGRLVEASSRQGKLDQLAAEIEAALQKHPDWAGGRALRAVLEARRGKVAEARKDLEFILADDAGVSSSGRMLVAQELDKVEALRDVELKLYEAAVADADQMNNGMDFRYGPGHRLALLYKKAGRDKEARAFVLKHWKGEEDPYNGSNINYAAYRKINNTVSIGALLVELGYPADAAKIYSEITNDSETFENAKAYLGNSDYYLNQIRRGLTRSLSTPDRPTAERTLKTLLTPRADLPRGEPKLDLAVLCYPRDLEKTGITCVFAESTKALKNHADLSPEIRELATRLVESDPNDLSIQTAGAILTAVDGKPETLGTSMARLTKAVDARPLEALSLDARPNARQRDEAAQQLVLWVVARECLKYDSTRSVGESLAARAREAARRQADNRWTLAMLRESGQAALDRGDRPAAEAAWHEMLKVVLANAQSATPAAPRRAATGPPPRSNPSVVTIDRFDQAAGLAKLAADHNLMPLSLDAVRLSLSGGPPVTPMAITNPNSGRVRASNNEPQLDAVSQRVEERLFGLEAVWTRAKVDPALIYEVLRDAVLPPARPGEIFLYARSLTLGNLKIPRSLGGMLVRWAVRAGKADELRAFIEARMPNPLAAAPAKVLLAQLAIERKDHASAIRGLDAIREPGPKVALAVTGEQACLAALPALDTKETADAAAKLLEATLPRLANSNADEPMGSLLVRLARYEYAAGRPAEGKAHLLEYVNRSQQSSLRYVGDYSVYRRRMFLARIAVEFARAGQLDDTLDQLGQYVDAPANSNYGTIGDSTEAIRRVAQMMANLPAEERYRRLRQWMLPTADRKSVRWLIEIVNEPRAPAPFPASKPIDDRGILATAGLLIDAARAVGKLDALGDELKPLADQNVENAGKLLALVDLAGGRPDTAKAMIDARIAELNQKPDGETNNRRSNGAGGADVADYLLAREALASGDRTLAGSGERLAGKLVSQAEGAHQTWILSRVRRELAQARARQQGAPDEVKTGDPGLALWTPVAVSGSGAIADEDPEHGRALWVESSGVVSRIAGAHDDFLMMRTPLTGTFEFSVDAYTGGFAEGHTGYGGLVAEPVFTQASSSVWSVGRSEMIHRPPAFLRGDSFNRMTIRVEPGRVRYLLNGHLFYDDPQPSPASPWLVLYAAAERHTAFRNPTITGRPEVPREVVLTHADRLDGWDASMFYESTPARRAQSRLDRYGNPAQNPEKPDDYDWIARDGEIYGRRTDTVAPTQVDYDGDGPRQDGGSVGTVQSRLAYIRPLGEGDEIGYEFFYDPGATAIHPAVGRVAYLFDPVGVRLHALVPAGSPDNGALNADNVLDDAAGSRGPVALKAKEWNAATVQIHGSNLAITINGTLVYERKLGDGEDRTFSLYHDKARVDARVRKVVLRGAWPTDLAPDRLARLFARDEAKGAAKRPALRVRTVVVGERFIAMGSGDFARSVRGLPAAERYAKLRHWVLAADDHPALRVAAEFGPTDPPISLARPDGSRVPVAPTIDSPAFDLIDTAVEAGKLDELAGAVERFKPGADIGRRSRLALLALIHDAQGKTKEAEAAINELRTIAPKVITKGIADWQLWPEVLVGSRLGSTPALNAAVKSLFDELVNVVQRDQIYGPMALHIRHLRGMATMLAEAGRKPADDPGRAGWVRATLASAESRGMGHPLPTWTYRDGVWTHYPGHNNDMMFLATPLKGDFELTCDLTSFNWREARISYGGVTIGILYDRKRYQVCHYGRIVSEGVIEPMLPDVPDWYPFRLVVKGGTLTAFAMGRKIHEQAVRAESDPWLALSAAGNVTAGFRNLKIVGAPTVPETIALSGGSDLTGWLGDYYGEPTTGEAAYWQKLGAEIVGRKLSAELKTPANLDPETNEQPVYPETIAGGKHETVLRYARPLAEDSTVSYEFYYEPGRSLVHPALDRLALVLDPAGVKLHRITDGRFDRTGLDPGNLADEPDYRRGPARLPLKEKAWNRVELSLKGQTLTLRLNGEPAYERPIEATNQRDFGFFHYADETEARVRDVTYRGNWPKAPPAELTGRPETTASTR